MKGLPLTRASGLLHFLRFLSEIGTPIDRLLAKVGLPAAAALSDPDADVLVPVHQVCALLDTAAREEGLEHLGFLVGERTPFSSLGGFGELVAQSSSLHEALYASVRILPAYSTDGRLRLALDGEQIFLQHSLDRRLKRGWQQVEQFNLMLLIQLVRLSQREWRPKKVHMRAPNGVGLEKFEALADAQIAFGHPSTSVGIPRALLREPLVAWVGPKLGVLGGKDLERELHRTAPSTDFLNSVKQVVRSFLHDGTTSLDRTAGATGMSIRTLQRRLRERGLSYSRLVEEERSRAAGEMITQSELRITDIAVELGYRDPTTFTHAFHRWTGLSPSEYRRHRGQPGSSTR